LELAAKLELCLEGSREMIVAFKEMVEYVAQAEQA